MQKPPPKKNAECDQCLEIKPLLMPVGLIPGWPVVVWEHLCLTCRTSMQMSKHDDKYGVPASVWEHSQNPKLREAYVEFLNTDINDM